MTAYNTSTTHIKNPASKEPVYENRRETGASPANAALKRGAALDQDQAGWKPALPIQNRRQGCRRDREDRLKLFLLIGIASGLRAGAGEQVGRNI